MSYDDATRISHALGPVTISGSASTLSVKGPAGKRGRLVAIAATVTTSVVGAGVKIDVGESGALTKYGTLAIGAQTAPEALCTDVRARNAAGVPDMIDADEEVLVTVAAGTSGVIVPTVTVDWF